MRPEDIKHWHELYMKVSEAELNLAKMKDDSEKLGRPPAYLNTTIQRIDNYKEELVKHERAMAACIFVARNMKTIELAEHMVRDLGRYYRKGECGGISSGKIYDKINGSEDGRC